MRSVLSLEADRISRSSGLMLQLFTQSRWPSSVNRAAPPSALQIFSDLSADAGNDFAA